MSTLEYFKATFCPEIEENWKGVLTKARTQIIWNSIKNMHQKALERALPKILRETKFPGVDEIISVCANEDASIRRYEKERQLATHSCTHCSSGVRVVNNVSYACNVCDLGKTLYPSWPVYNGQTELKSQVRIEEGYEIREEGRYIYRNKIGAKNILSCSFTIKYFTPVKEEKPQNNVKYLRRYGDDF